MFTTLKRLIRRRREARQLEELSKGADNASFSGPHDEMQSLIQNLLKEVRMLSADEHSQGKRDSLKQIEATGELLIALLPLFRGAGDISEPGGVVEETDFAPMDLFRQIEGLFRRRALEKGVNLFLDFGGEIPTYIFGDKLRIAQILINLVHQSIEATDVGEVAITCLFQQETLIFSIANSGLEKCPADAVQAKNILTHGSSPQKSSGRASGLTNTAQMVRLLGGQLSSRTEARLGTVITVEIPLKPPPPRRSAPADLNTAANNWLEKHRNNPQLIKIFFKSLEELKRELDHWRETTDKERPKEILRSVHTMKGFPGGFGLTWVYDKLKEIEQIAMGQPERTSLLKAALAELDEILRSFPPPETTLSAASFHHKNFSDEAQPHDKAPSFRILAAEDDLLCQDLLLYVFKSLGVDYQIVSNGDDVLATLQKRVFDLILLDMQMPKKDGIETIRAIRANEDWRELPVIAVTASNLEGDEKMFREEGCDDFMAKPIDIQLLTEKLKQQIKRGTK